MSNIQTGAERMPHDLSHLGFLAGQIGRLITISTTPVIAGDSFDMVAVGALRLSPLLISLAIVSLLDIFIFYLCYYILCQLRLLSRATLSRWSPLALSVFLHCVVALLLTLLRSEERRVGKECRAVWSSKDEKKDKRKSG